MLLCCFSMHNAYMASLSCVITHDRIYRPETKRKENGHQRGDIQRLAIRDDVISANLHQIISFKGVFTELQNDLSLCSLKHLYRTGIISVTSCIICSSSFI